MKSVRFADETTTKRGKTKRRRDVRAKHNDNNNNCEWPTPAWFSPEWNPAQATTTQDIVIVESEPKQERQ